MPQPILQIAIKYQIKDNRVYKGVRDWMAYNISGTWTNLDSCLYIFCTPRLALH